jgi:hypothetical protein
VNILRPRLAVCQRLLLMLLPRPTDPPSVKAWELDETLLPGEDPVRIQDGDVEHWVSVYDELLVGNRRILREMGDAGNEPLRRHVEQLEIGLDFWTRQRRRVEV